MKTIFALCGSPGAGKTTLSNNLSKYYKSIIFSIDKMMLKLFGEIVGDRKIFEEKAEACKKITFDYCDDILKKSNLNIILDWGFWTKSGRKYLRNRFKEYKVIFIYLNVDEETLWKRIEYRNNNLKNGEYFMDKETLKFFINMYETFDINEKHIEVKNNYKIKYIINEIKNY